MLLLMACRTVSGLAESQLRRLLWALSPSDWARDVLGYNLDPWQVEALSSGSRRVLMNCSRQVGKSTVAGILAAHTAEFNPGSLALVIAPSLRQSEELYRRIRGFLRDAGSRVSTDDDSTTHCSMRNGSRIIALPGDGDTVRVFSEVSALIVDEASRLPDSVIAAVRPMIAVSGGVLWAMSTPAGPRGWWWEAWTGRGTWDRYEIPATDCPRISAAFLEEERAMLGPLFAQEYLCQFVADGASVFDEESILAAFDCQIPGLKIAGVG